MIGYQVLKLQLGLLELDLNDSDSTGFVIKTVDLGSPAVRAVTSDLPAQDGADDQTQFFSARSVHLSGAIVRGWGGDSRSKNLDALAPFISPKARPTLVYALDTDVEERCLDMRVGQWTNPIDHPENATAFSVQWVCPNPIAYEQAINEVDVALGAESHGARVYPLTYPRSYPGTAPALATPIFSGGTYETWPTLRIYGPTANPSVIWLDPSTSAELGIQVVLKGLGIGSTDFLEIDTRAKTVLMNGDPGANRYNFVDFAKTNWGPLQPDANLIKYIADSASPPTKVAVLWRDCFLN